MDFSSTKLEDLRIISTDQYTDSRGYFARAWCAEEFNANGLTAEFVQSSISYNIKKGTLRGMHFQRYPSKETKLVRCISGSIYDVLIDIRENSATYGQHEGFTLSASNSLALYVPPGFAHGFQTLQHDTSVLYMMTDYYQPELASGIRWNDPRFGIVWPDTENPTIIERDRKYADFTDELIRDFRNL